ncbi:hypothetical protein [Paraconexibacter sp.]|uniref:hypothetical protein n=1 Tax=Paraconexibacter sp. TaxID=2949640 RepID=UPI003563647A
MNPQHKPILAVAAVFIIGFAVLTVFDILANGPNFLTAVSLLVLAMFGFGIVGALRQPPDP